MSPKQAAVGIYQENYAAKRSTGSFGGENSYATLPKPASLTGKLIVSSYSSWYVYSHDNTSPHWLLLNLWEEQYRTVTCRAIQCKKVVFSLVSLWTELYKNLFVCRFCYRVLIIYWSLYQIEIQEEAQLILFLVQRINLE
jgi:hypothetical protein